MDRDHETNAALGLLTPFATPVTAPLALLAKGGITTAYFSFAYEGFDPHVALLTTNTFDPFERMMTALSVEREDVGSRSFEAAEKRLNTWLDEGSPVAVWLDLWSLPWLGFETPDPGMYGTFPLVVEGREGAGYRFFNRTEQPRVLTQEALQRAWGRIKKDRFRMLRITEIHPEGLIGGLTSSLVFCADLFLTGPRPGIPAKNFGLRAYDTWAGVLTSSKGPQSWAKLFTSGRRFLNGVATAWGGQWGLTGLAPGDARRRDFAQGLRDLAALDTSRPWASLAPAFEAAARAWEGLSEALLPAGHPIRRNLEAQDRATRMADSAVLLPSLRKEYQDLLAAEEAVPTAGLLLAEWKERIASQLPLVKADDEEAFRALAAVLS